MKYVSELLEIISRITKGFDAPNTLDIVIEILKKYYSSADVGDITMVSFLNEYFPDNKSKEKLIDEVIKFQIGYTGDSFNDSIRVLKTSEKFSEMFPHYGDLLKMISTSHFLLAALSEIPGLSKVFEESGGGLKELIQTSEDHKKDYETITEVASDIFNKIFPPKNREDGEDSDDDFSLAESFMESMGFPVSEGESSKGTTKSKTPMLDKYAKELTKEDTDKIYGRESELSQLLEILGCKKKNNAILIGEPGVGKTSVVELLAQRIKEKKVPPQFIDRRIFSLDLNSLVAGTKYRGQYEERLQGVIEEVVSNPEVIIFIDEIHNLIGNGGSEGNGDAANILKPYLAKGKFQCIGSTTFREYRKYIEKDGALKRRFQNIRIEEPTPSDTLTILQEIKKSYENFHNVSYPKEILDLCVGMSARYLPDRYFPDKAIDLLDLSGSLARLRCSSKETENYLKSEETAEEMQAKKIKAVMEIKFDDALEYRKKEDEARQKLNNPGKNIKVSVSDVYQAVGKRSGVPIDSIGKTDLDKLRNLNTVLPTQVIGQSQAIKDVILSLQKNSLGIRDPQKPIASLLFVGPTGSGKTYLCKTLAKEFFGSEDSLIKYDMSEYGERHEITKLTGAAASYVGYEDEPAFEMVRKHPYSVVLFDEIEKAAPEIYQIFLSILDEGYVTLGNGTRVNFKNTIIIFTGNIGTKELSLFGRGLGYGSVENKEIPEKTKKDSIIKKAIEKTFAPEFINRLSKIIIFESLGKSELMKIADLEITKLSARLKSSKIVLKISKALKEFIISECDLKYGARDLQRMITKNIEEVLCEKLLSPDIPDGSKTFSLDIKDGEVTIELRKKKKKEDGNELLRKEETEGIGKTEVTPEA